MNQATIIVEGTFREGYERYFEEYSRIMKAFLAKHQGTTLRRQLIKKTLYGTDTPSLIMVIDFPTEELAESLFFEKEYLDVIPLRDRIFADFRMYLAEFGNV
ncbi:MAG TPA: DUF1330 domain-containing protein [Thermoanaerobaculia bacterium]|nr:DUF1330 domain-containing protein [Thermoanaerobaculia bacterium]